VKITVKVGEKTYSHETRSLLNSEAIRVKRQIGMTIPEWQQGLDEQDPEAQKALVFLLMDRAGENPEWETLDFDHGDLDYEAAEDAPAGPKEDAGQGSSTTTPT
jgi:hypothetical protein